MKIRAVQKGFKFASKNVQFPWNLELPFYILVKAPTIMEPLEVELAGGLNLSCLDIRDLHQRMEDTALISPAKR